MGILKILVKNAWMASGVATEIRIIQYHFAAFRYENVKKRYAMLK